MQDLSNTKFVSVAHAAGQWLVSVENEVPQTFATRGRAVVAAHEVARRVHREAGKPAVVRALLSNGEWSVLMRFDKPRD
jgi:hypothetical protein